MTFSSTYSITFYYVILLYIINIKGRMSTKIFAQFKKKRVSQYGKELEQIFDYHQKERIKINMEP